MYPTVSDYSIQDQRDNQRQVGPANLLSFALDTLDVKVFGQVAQLHSACLGAEKPLHAASAAFMAA